MVRINAMKKPNGFIFNAPGKSPRSINNTDLEVPQDGQGIWLTVFMRQIPGSVLPEMPV
jgi:hypothetical protein